MRSKTLPVMRSGCYIHTRLMCGASSPVPKLPVKLRQGAEGGQPGVMSAGRHCLFAAAVTPTPRTLTEPAQTIGIT
jgi:hypothetical protein